MTLIMITLILITLIGNKTLLKNCIVTFSISHTNQIDLHQWVQNHSNQSDQYQYNNQYFIQNQKNKSDKTKFMEGYN